MIANSLYLHNFDLTQSSLKLFGRTMQSFDSIVRVLRAAIKRPVPGNQVLSFDEALTLCSPQRSPRNVKLLTFDSLELGRHVRSTSPVKEFLLVANNGWANTSADWRHSSVKASIYSGKNRFEGEVNAFIQLFKADDLMS